MDYTVFGRRGDVTGPESNILAVHYGGGSGVTERSLTFEMVPGTSGRVAA